MCLECIKLYCKNALFYIIVLYVATFRNVTPTVKEKFLDSFVMYMSIAMVPKLKDAVRTNIHIRS